MCNKVLKTPLIITSTYGTKYSWMDEVKFVEDRLLKSWRDVVCLSRPYPFKLFNWRDMVCLSKSYPFKFFKGCLPQILLGYFLNTFSYITLEVKLPSRAVIDFFSLSLEQCRRRCFPVRRWKRKICGKYRCINIRVPKN